MLRTLFPRKRRVAKPQVQVLNRVLSFWAAVGRGGIESPSSALPARLRESFPELFQPPHLVPAPTKSSTDPHPAPEAVSIEVGTPFGVCPRRSQDSVRAAVASSLWRQPSRPRPSERMATGRYHATWLYCFPWCLSGFQQVGRVEDEGSAYRATGPPRCAGDVTER